MVPTLRERSDERVALEPFELMQLETRRTVHVFGRERTATRIVEQDNARPILLFVPRLRLIEEFRLLARDMLIDSVTSAGASPEETLQIVAAGILASPAFQWR